MNKLEKVFCVMLVDLIDNAVIFDRQSYEKIISVREIKSCLTSFFNETDKNYISLVEKIGMDNKKISQEALTKAITAAFYRSFMCASDKNFLPYCQAVTEKFVNHFRPVIDKISYYPNTGIYQLVLNNFKIFVKSKMSEEVFKSIEIDVDKASLRCANRLNEKAYDMHNLSKRVFAIIYGNNKAKAWMKKNFL